MELGDVDVAMQDVTATDEPASATDAPQSPPDPSATAAAPADSDNDGDGASDDDESGSDASSDDEPPVESLVAGRARRTNAGNLMARALAAEDDGDTDLLFAEEGEDEEFDAVGDNDAAVDDEEGEESSSSSDDDDDDHAHGDNLAGEAELRKQERAEKRSTKRKAPGPQPIRKRVKIADPAKADGPAKRPKKSERLSWLPSENDAPTRVSSRKLAVENKVRTLENLKESGIRAAGVRERMEITNARKKAMERPPMTQEERLEEAARTEKLNLKSVKRWEQQESDRQARQQAELERLRNKKLEGPVIRWYSGPCEWDYKDRLHRIGRTPKVEAIDIEIEGEIPQEPESELPQEKNAEIDGDTKPETNTNAIQDADEDVSMVEAPLALPDEARPPDTIEQQEAPQNLPAEERQQSAEPVAEMSNDAATQSDDQPAAGLEQPSSVPPTASEPTHSTEASIALQPTDDVTVDATADATAASSEDLPPTDPSTEDRIKPEAPSHGSFLAGIEEYASMAPEASQPAAADPQDTIEPAPRPSASAPAEAAATTTAPKASTTPPKPAVPKPPPRPGQAQALTLIAFDGNTLAKHPEAVRRILLKATVPNPSSATSRSASAIHLASLRPVQPTCAITNLPARYRDPLTGLPYRDMESFKILRDTVDGCLFRETEAAATTTTLSGGLIARGRYGPCWSTLLGAWVGREGVTARNVPLGFVHGTVAVPLPPPVPVPAVPAADSAPAAGAGSAAVKAEG